MSGPGLQTASQTKFDAPDGFADILVVDDIEQNRAVLRGHIDLLGHGCREAEHGREALERMNEAVPDLVLLDMNMPIMDGRELLSEMKNDTRLAAVPVIVISGNDDTDLISECVRAGADDYIVKPFQPRILRARIENSLAKLRLRRVMERDNLELEQRVQSQVRQIAEAQLGTIFALSVLAESRDPETGAHLERIQSYCWVLAEGLAAEGPYTHEISPAYVELLHSTSPLHDIGKVGIPDHVLQKPGKLTDDEFDIMKTHCAIGADTLLRLKEKYPENAFLAMGHEIALYHHEKWNGAGYPNGTAGLDIPLSARILALCDVYDALTSKRCYKDAFSHEKSAAIIREERDKHFDPAVADAFDRCEARFQEIARTFRD